MDPSRGFSIPMLASLTHRDSHLVWSQLLRNFLHKTHVTDGDVPVTVNSQARQLAGLVWSGPACHVQAAGTTFQLSP